jgi:uncharacterized protein YaaR (DUF327 family)
MQRAITIVIPLADDGSPENKRQVKIFFACNDSVCTFAKAAVSSYYQIHRSTWFFMPDQWCFTHKLSKIKVIDHTLRYLVARLIETRFKGFLLFTMVDIKVIAVYLLFQCLERLNIMWSMR